MTLPKFKIASSVMTLPDLYLLVQFKNGKIKKYDVKPLVKEIGAFKQLKRNKSLFKNQIHPLSRKTRSPRARGGESSKGRAEARFPLFSPMKPGRDFQKRGLIALPRGGVIPSFPYKF